MSFTQWVIVDDASADINYLGKSWISAVGSWVVGSFGTPHLDTLHGTGSNASFIFNFTGSGVRVVGSISSDSEYWACSIDGVNMRTEFAFEAGAPRNNFVFCTVSSLGDGHHTLTVNATPPYNQTFWFDRIEYIPSPQAKIEQKSIGVALGGPGLDSPELDSPASTTFVFTFYGISVSWYGTLFTNPGNLSWSMDNADNNIISNWTITSSNASYPLLNQKFFETPIYSIGMHTLKVSFIVNGTPSRLRFSYLVVHNGTLLPTSTTESSSPHSTASTSGTSRPTATGIIAGGVTGGVLLFGLAIFGFYFFRRRFKSKRTEFYSDEPIPFNQPERPAYLSLQTRPGQRKSQMISSHSQNSPSGLPPSNINRIIHQTNPMNEPPTSVLSRLSVQDIRDHGRRPEPIPARVPENVEADIGQVNDLLVPGPPRIVVHKDSGMRFNGQTTPVPNPP